jgi:hypothetical protein
MEKYTIKYDNLSTIQDFSDEAENFIRDSFEIYQESTEALYIGYRKPFNSFHVELSQFSSNQQALVVEYWNGLAWTSVPKLLDSTKGLSRNGFVDFSREIDDWESTIVDGDDLYYVRVSGTLLNDPQVTTKIGNTTSRLEVEDADIGKLDIGDTILFDTSLDGFQEVVITAKDDTAAAAYIDFAPSTANPVDDNTIIYKPLVVSGINVLFSSDIDIVEITPYIENNINYLPKGYSSFVPYHQAARKSIVQDLRNKGKAKYNNSDYNDSNLKWSNLTQFDILDRQELLEAARNKVMALMYFNLSDDPEDNFSAKAKQHSKKYHDAISLAFLSLDKNDDGKVNDGENLTRQVTRMLRL